MSSVLVEMYVNSAWTDITADVYTRDPISITRGKANESSQVAPSNCNLTLNNRLGKYSPRNPLSTYYGRIGRNTPIRVRAGQDAAPQFDASSSPIAGTGNLSWTHTPVGTPSGVLVWVQQSGATLNQVTSVTYGGVNMPLSGTGDGLDPVGGLYKRYLLGSGVPAGPQAVVVTVSGAAPKQAVAISVTSTGTVSLANTPSATTGAGTADPGVSVVTTKPALIFGLLHSSQAAITSVAPGTGYVDVLEYSFGADVMSVIRATAPVSPGSTALSWVSTAANWQLNDVALTSTTMTYRFWGEVSSFPARWDTSGRDAYVQIECAGILRRLGQGVAAPASGLQDVILANIATLRGYWPLTGAFGTRYSLDIGLTPGSRFYGWAGASFKYGEPLGTNLGTGIAVFDTGNGFLRGDVGSPAATVAADYVFQSPDLGSLDLGIDDYSGYTWTLNLSGGRAQVSFTDPAIGPVAFAASAVLPELSDTLAHHVRLSLTKSGADTVWTVYVDGVSVSTGTKTAYNLDGCSKVLFYYTRTTHSWVVLAHVAVWETTFPTAADLTLALNGYVGEAAGTRIARITSLAGYALTTIGTASDTLPMGVQHAEELLTQLRDAESTDLGMLTEPRGSFGLLYRTRRSLHNQAAKLTLDYDGGQVAPPFEPVDDDQSTRNDVTAVRRDGDSYRATQETGAMSVLEPPNGIGRYKDEYTANVATDDQLPDLAGWLLHQGTVDEARYPSVRVNLASPAAAAIVAAALAVDIGDRIVIIDARPVNIYDNVSLIVLGYTETLDPFEHVVTFNCAPASTYEVVRVDDVTTRWSSGEASTLTSSLTTTATSMSVTSTAGTLWTTSAGDMPISLMIAGEEMTVTAISGAASPQTFTVTRSVNGVVKTQSAGAIVRLKRRAVWAL